MTTSGLVAEYKLAPAQMTNRFTATTDLFVLAHFGIPEVSARNWTLSVDGQVDTPLTITLNDLMARPKRVVEAVHKCAGSPLHPTRPTRQVANVKWAGVDLYDLLSEAGIGPGATHIWAYGLDHGHYAGQTQDYYLKDLPLGSIERGDVLVAYELNDQPLSDEHGFPARLVVPGFFGTNSVKWLSRLWLADGRPDSLFTSSLYNDPVPGSAAKKPVWEVSPESLIVSPAADATLPTGVTEVWGWAWSAGEVESVDVSTDGGITWHRSVLEPRTQHNWQRFSLKWQIGQAGRYQLLSRATDMAGEAQPLNDARNAVYSVTVTVEE